MLRTVLLHLCSGSSWLDCSAPAWRLSPWRTRHTTPRHGVTRLGLGIGLERCWRSARRAAAPLLCSLVAGVCLASSALAAVPYDINQAYVGASQVNFNGQIYEAKWYANPGQTPGMQVANAWETPWQAVGNDTEEPDGSVPQLDGGGSPDDTSATVVLHRDALEATEADLTDFPAMAQVKAAIATRTNPVVDAVAPGWRDNPDNVKRVETMLSAQSFDYLFSLRAPEYTYLGFLQAVAKFPAFCGAYTDGRDAEALCRKSLATMFAHFGQETGAHDPHSPIEAWRQGLYWVREMGWTESMPGGYNSECALSLWQGQTWPCGTFANGEFKSYFGRGAKQLSYSYNYGPFSEAMFGTVRTLLDHPEQVADTWLNLASAVFFFVYPQPPKPAMLHVIDGTWQPNALDIRSGLLPGFGVTTQIINGGVECGGSTEQAQSSNRLTYYRSLAQYLHVPIAANEVLGCRGMRAFAEGGAGALPIYWEQDWSYIPSNPNGGKSYACQLVGYQTPFSAFKPGDYARCVQHFFPEVVIEDHGGTNQPPVAVITGPSQAKGGATVTLSGQASTDPEGGALRYQWTLPAGVSAVARNQLHLEAWLPSPPADTSLRFVLQVTDDQGASDTAQHVLLVQGASGGDPGDAPAYQEGFPYQAGDIVSSQGGLYQCKPFPYSGWCAGAAWAYAPGTGTAWDSAWEQR